ncbi:MAG: hypothetical protein R3B72_45080 [Polyangiaceae bacterium]
MTRESNGSRSAIPIVVATASVTLAIGVTAAALGGYLVPNRPEGERPSAPSIVEQPASSPSGVVLVPIVPDAPPEPPIVLPPAPEPEGIVTAIYEPEHHHDDEHHGRRARRHEDDDDDD